MEAFDLRQKADYRDYWEVEPERIEQLIRWAEEFLGQVDPLLDVESK